MLAAMNGHVPAVKLLLDMGSDINAQIETNRNTALTLACFQGRAEVVSLLLDRKANVEHRAKVCVYLTMLLIWVNILFCKFGAVMHSKHLGLLYVRLMTAAFYCLQMDSFEETADCEPSIYCPDCPYHTQSHLAHTRSKQRQIIPTAIPCICFVKLMASSSAKKHPVYFLSKCKLCPVSN